MQKAMTLSTKSESLRSEVFGWGQEDPALYVPGKAIGFTPSPRPYEYPGTVLEALARGWKLLAPPERYEFTNDDGETLVEWSWWLVKDG